MATPTLIPTLPPAEPPEPHPWAELARMFATAFVAYQLEVRFQTALKRYGHTPVGTFWLDVAELVATEWARTSTRDFHPTPPLGWKKAENIRQFRGEPRVEIEPISRHKRGKKRRK